MEETTEKYIMNYNNVNISIKQGEGTYWLNITGQVSFMSWTVSYHGAEPRKWARYWKQVLLSIL